LNSSIYRKNTSSWRYDTSVVEDDIEVCWRHVRERATNYMQESTFFSLNECYIDTILEREPGVDMLRPYYRATSAEVPG